MNLPPASGAPDSSDVRVPAEGPESTWCTLFHRDGRFTSLAEAELRALGGGGCAEPGVWLSPVPIRWASCGYGIAAGRQLAFAATLEELGERMRALGLVAPRFSITTRRLPRNLEGGSAAARLVGECIAGQVSTSDPLLRLLLVVTPLGFRVLVEQQPHPGEDAWLAASHKPQNYLVALPVRIARAMLNLTAKPGDSVLDPFCGSGTIPLLAAWAGHRAYASDISAACVERTAENLAHFKLAATLTCGDAQEASQAADCIVTNLPYGLYSHTTADALRPILQNLGRLAPKATFVTSERITPELEAEGYVVEQVVSVEAERFERLVYVTRTPSGR